MGLSAMEKFHAAMLRGACSLAVVKQEAWRSMNFTRDSAFAFETFVAAGVGPKKSSRLGFR